ncbi:hypothetical protein BaRGS_00020528 [Batillaria attramentaria]|uniref:Uncharacterized protein n=1 Tax=Batillaria attramentaria TaxID=370345 RepID=A0ABD0KMB0_9CAEN
MEVTSCVAEKAKSVSVVDLIKVPFQLVLGDRVGAAMQKILYIKHITKDALLILLLWLELTHVSLGLETAVFLHKKARSVTVVGRSKVPLEPVFGAQIGAAIAKLHESKGVKFYFERGIKEFRGKDGQLTQAVLSDDTVLDADLCQMKTNQPGVFAAGDIVKFPLFINGDQPSNIQHWQMAHKLGRVAALNMLGKKVDVHSVPYFWTVMYGKSLRYTGYGPGYDDIVIHGDVDALQFAAFYTKGDKVVAVASLAFDPIVSQAASLMEQGQSTLQGGPQELGRSPEADVMRDDSCHGYARIFVFAASSFPIKQRI